MEDELALQDKVFRPTATGLIINGKPTYEVWEAYGKKLRFVEGAIQWLIGDWLNYGELKWGEMYSQAVDETQAHTWRQYKYISDRVQLSTRVDNLSWSHHREISALDLDNQKKYLDLAVSNCLTVNELRYQIITDTKILAPPLKGKYAIIYADPPWNYDNSGFDQSAAKHYPTMSTEEICALPIADLVEKSAVLFLWATSPLLPEALQVMESWGFEYKTSRVWIKQNGPSIGWWINTRHEFLLIGAFGENLHPLEKLDSVILETSREHSRKPECVYSDIEKAYPRMKKIELFARNERANWSMWGNEIV